MFIKQYCEQQRRRPDCLFSLSNQHRFPSLPRYYMYIISLSHVASVSALAGWFVSYLRTTKSPKLVVRILKNVCIVSALCINVGKTTKNVYIYCSV